MCTRRIAGIQEKQRDVSVAESARVPQNLLVRSATARTYTARPKFPRRRAGRGARPHTAARRACVAAPRRARSPPLLAAEPLPQLAEQALEARPRLAALGRLPVPPQTSPNQTPRPRAPPEGRGGRERERESGGTRAAEVAPSTGCGPPRAAAAALSAAAAPRRPHLVRRAATATFAHAPRAASSRPTALPRPGALARRRATALLARRAPAASRRRAAARRGVARADSSTAPALLVEPDRCHYRRRPPAGCPHRAGAAPTARGRAVRRRLARAAFGPAASRRHLTRPRQRDRRWMQAGADAPKRRRS